MFLKKTDLHVHIQQAMHIEDLYMLAKDHYKEINWNRLSYLDRYQKQFGVRPDMISIFENAAKTGSLHEIEEIACYPYKGNGNFDEFNPKSLFCICVQGYFADRDIIEPVYQMIVDRHKREGLTYVEYRQGCGGTEAEQKAWHARNARFCKNACTDTFTAKYIARLGSYKAIKEMIAENPDLADTVVGVDLSGKEKPPEVLKDFYAEIAADRKRNPINTPDVVVHIGENFFDKSLESAIRWCHQTAQFGAKRLGHCIALGMNPYAAVNRQPQAHEFEPVGERIAQIKYDLKFEDYLAKYGVFINRAALSSELHSLEKQNPSDSFHKAYDTKRLDEAAKRQDFVLDELKRLGTVIEVCPTSNLCIGGVPSIKEHPFIKLYHSGVNMAICTDDPGIFKSSLSDEVDFVMRSFDINREELCERLGDPYRFRLK